jgi:hypothetical protein
MLNKLYYCLHDCIINKIKCEAGTIKTLYEWNKHLEDYPHPIVNWNNFFFYEMKDENDIPVKWWGNGSHKKTTNEIQNN